VAQDVVGALNNYSRRGMNVVCVIHQPRQSIFEMFDSVTLLAKGQTVYHGPQFLTVSVMGVWQVCGVWSPHTHPGDTCSVFS
jgi:ABC-type multidrug transport system ATPase subunit